ncbi:MAG: Uncharacterised protein [Methanobacteriota archaeon]|nr:MAG: Uncharacterised protein [Euryarchaeota archaeon]
MADIFGYGEKDRTNVVYLLIFLVSIFSIFFFVQNDLKGLLISGGVNSSSTWVPLILIAIFRTLCAALAFHTLIWWMLLDKKGGFMNAYFRKEKEVLSIHIYHLERFVTFSSWNLIIFCLTFITSATLSWFEFFELYSPELFHIISSVLLSTSLGMATVTATVITYVIVPLAIKKGSEIDHLFEPHQMVMHNWAVIFLIADVIFTVPLLSWKFAIFGLVIGILYVVFAYIFAIWGKGYYVYSFIDPRLKYAPFIMLILALMIGLFYIFVWVGIKIIEWNNLIGSMILIGWIYSIVLFKPKSIVLFKPKIT